MDFQESGVESLYNDPAFGYIDKNILFNTGQYRKVNQYKRKRRYFNVLKQYFLTKEERNWIDSIIMHNLLDMHHPKRKKALTLTRLQILMSILNLYYSYFITSDYKMVSGLIERELDRLYTITHTSVHTPSRLFYRTFIYWLKFRDYKICAKKLGCSVPFFYRTLHKVQVYLSESKYIQLVKVGMYLEYLNKLNKHLVRKRK